MRSRKQPTNAAHWGKSSSAGFVAVSNVDNPSSASPTTIDGGVLFVTAHPDDETMFFLPTITRLLEAWGHDRVYLLCLSTGNFDGLGHKRTRELLDCCVGELGFRPGHVVCVDDPLMQDGPNVEWDVQHIAQILDTFVRDHDISQVIIIVLVSQSNSLTLNLTWC